MATPGWRTGHPLNEQWQAHHAGFDYYQLVSLLLREGTRARGRPATLDSDVRFRGDLSGAFTGHEVSGLERRRDGSVCLSSANYSVASPLGPLPDPYGEWARERAAQGDRAMADFLDLFTHRLHALRFAIKARFRPGLTGEAPEETELGARLGAVSGLADEGERLPVSRRALLALAGLLADRRRSAAAIAAVVSAWVEAPTAIEQMRGAWQAIPRESRMRLGQRNTRLGSDAVLGTRVWDQEARIVVTITPRSDEQFRALLPGGARHEELAVLLRFLTDRCVDVEVCLRAEQTTGLRLGRGESPLGFRSWLGDRRHPGESRFVIHAFEPEENP